MRVSKIPFVILVLFFCFAGSDDYYQQDTGATGTIGDTFIWHANADDCTADRDDASSAGSSCDIEGTATGAGTAPTVNNPCGGSYAIEMDGAANNYIAWPLTYNVATLDGSIFLEFDLYISVDNDGAQTLFYWVGDADNSMLVTVDADGYIYSNYRAGGVNAWFISTTAVTNSGCRQIQVKCDPTAGSNEVGVRVCLDGTCDAESWEYEADNITKWGVNLTSLEVGEGNGGYNDTTGTYHIDDAKMWDNAAQN